MFSQWSLKAAFSVSSAFGSSRDGISVPDAGSTAVVKKLIRYGDNYHVRSITGLAIE
jgi:hypothetical protein